MNSVSLFATSLAFGAEPQQPSLLELHTRGRRLSSNSPDGFKVVSDTIVWPPQKTALVVVDMWDDHWCRGAAQRVEELAGPMNKFITAARERGVFVVHCPSTCVEHYKDTPARQRAIEAAFTKPPIELATSERWGTAWCWPDEPREPQLPIDDSDMGCDCEVKCQIKEPWTRQIATIDIDHNRDAITHDGQELYNMFAERGIENVMICGVHLNMCVLGRPFAIRQLVKLGQNVVLVRDLTDSMYNHHMRPFVDHFTGTDLVVEHVEKYWCPSIESTDLVGGEPFRFRR
jgi:nicotinamidase-related amidase